MSVARKDRRTGAVVTGESEGLTGPAMIPYAKQVERLKQMARAYGDEHRDEADSVIGLMLANAWLDGYRAGADDQP